jgi:hypothetical protein
MQGGGIKEGKRCSEGEHADSKMPKKKGMMQGALGNW